MNPSDKSCFALCKSCYRCGDKGRYAKCQTCSGRHDPFEKIPEDPDDFCQCTQGVLRWKTRNGKLIIRRMKNDPFAGQVITQSKTQDERDWENYLVDLRERMDDETYNPIIVEDVNPFEKNFKVL